MNLQRLPKIDLHLHLDGAIRTNTIRDLADQQDIRLPEPLAKHVTVGRSCRNLMDFLKCFDTFLPVIRTPAAIERIAYELCEDCAADNVVYFEARYAPLLQQTRKFSLEESVQAALCGLQRGSRDFGVENNLILCMLRDHPRYSLRTVKAAVKYGAAGVDIANDERKPASAHAAAFRLARKKELPITVHCGEAGPPANIWEAIDKLGALRIGHGVTAADDPRLLDRLAEREIGLETCLTSNLQTRAVPILKAHPFPLFYKVGIPVSLNTDDPRVSRTTLTREFELARKTFQLRRPEIRQLLDNAVKTAFCTPSQRSTLRKRTAL